MQLDQIETVFICGPTASGKTFLMKHLILSQERFCVLDSCGEMYGMESCVHFESGTFRNYFQYLNDNPHSHRIVYHAGGDLGLDFEIASQGYWQLITPRWLMLDECHEYAKHPYFSAMMRYSRKRKLGLLLASQRIADVPKSLTAAARTAIIFHSPESRDHEAVYDRFGGDAEKIMEVLQPLIHDDGTGETKQTPHCFVYHRGGNSYVVDLGNMEHISPESYLLKRKMLPTGISTRNF